MRALVYRGPGQRLDAARNGALEVVRTRQEEADE
jgi:hypothetical protein